MQPVEYLFLILGGFIALISMARGYAKDLGNTLIFMVAIFLLSFLDPQIERGLNIVGQTLFGINTLDTSWGRQIMALAFIGVFISIVFASYAGRTFEYGGTQAPPPQGTLLNLAIGLLNGYLVSGTVWYYLDKYDYPLPEFQPPLSAFATSLIPFLPENIFPTPVFWMLPVALLILLKVRG